MNPSSLINAETWRTAADNLSALLKLRVDGGDIRDLPGGGYVFRLASSVSRRVYPFQVSASSPGVVRVQNGVVFCSGQAFPFPSQMWAVGSSDWLLYIGVRLNFSTWASGDPLVDPWNIVPNVVTGTGRPIVRMGLVSLSSLGMGEEATVKYKAAGLPELESTEGDVHWPIATSQGGVIIQHTKNHLVFSIRPNGHLSANVGYPDVETATL